MRKKIDSYLGFAKKSGNLVSGANTCTVTATRGRVKLLIIAEDIAENSREKMIKLAQSKNIPYVIYGLSDELSRITGTSGRSVFGITDRNFAQTIATVIEAEKLTEKEVF